MIPAITPLNDSESNYFAIILSPTVTKIDNWMRCVGSRNGRGQQSVYVAHIFRYRYVCMLTLLRLKVLAIFKSMFTNRDKKLFLQSLDCQFEKSRNLLEVMTCQIVFGDKSAVPHLLNVVN